MPTDGFEFVEYTAPDIELLRSLFTKMGFPEVARHKSKNVTLHKQADCNFIINAAPGSYAEEFAKAHGPSACAMAFRVKDAKAAHQRALKLGATNVEVRRGDGELGIPAIEGIGGSRLFFVDRYGDGSSIYEVDFDFHPDWRQRMAQADSKLTYIDHLTHNVNRGRMAVWAGFYERLFNFREIRYFDIEGKQTGLFSKAMTSRTTRARSRSSSANIRARASSTSRSAPRTSTPRSTSSAPAAFPSRTRPTLITRCFPSGSKAMRSRFPSSRSAAS